MSEQDKFKSAQRAYDNQNPPDFYTYTATCPTCDGDGKVWDDGAPDAVPIECKNCDGSGEVEIDTRSTTKRQRDE